MSSKCYSFFRIGTALILWAGLAITIPSENLTFPTFPNHTTKETLIHHQDHRNESDLPLDFVIAGFEKCGTSYLMHLLEQHNETDMVRREFCQISSPKRDDNDLYQGLQNELSLLPSTVKLGIKCPSVVRHGEGLRRLQQWYPATKLLVGLRHPVHWFQSFYNFRVMRVHYGKLNVSIPPATSLIETAWLHVSTNLARFEYDLVSLGRRQDQLMNNSVSPLTPFPVVLYSLEQIMDTNETRRASFARGLADFLGLTSTLPLRPIRRNAAPDTPNTNPTLDNFAESIDICQNKYKTLRDLLVEQGGKTQERIRDKVLSLFKMTVIDQEYFLETLSQWTRDPCL